MCGICGVFSFQDGLPNTAMVDTMNRSLVHRGPDGSGTYASGRIALAHRRLSIIDVSGGSQPMANETGSIQVVFNGEIYNFIELRKELQVKGHIFQTSADTEVIVHGYEEWGTDCVHRFNGMFAFALWDGARQQLLLARDHLGVKPLYYVRLRNRLLFASEIKALIQDPECPREVDPAGLSMLFTLRYVPSPGTLFRDIKKLPPGHIMIVRPDGTCVRRFWSTTPEIQKIHGEEAATEEYQALVEDAVRLQMRSDVPVGLFLSSGVDSAALLSLMTRHASGPVRTFTIGFEDGQQTNETSDARDVALRFGADHDEMIVGASDYEKYYQRYLSDIEEPLGNESAAAFYFVSLIAGRKVKVAITGQGADEQWAGYGRHLGANLSKLYSRLPPFLTGMLRPLLKRASSERLQRAALSLDEKDVLTRFIKIYSFFSAEIKAELFRPGLLDIASPSGIEARDALRWLHNDVSTLDPLSQLLYIDVRSSLPDDLLTVSDKTSMANSIECRVPYLDHRIVEFVERLPPNLKIRHMRGKYLHRKSAEKWVPKELAHRKKKGFANPVHRWMRDRLRGYIRECLLSESAAVNQYFEPAHVRRLVLEHNSGLRNHFRHIYLLLSFEMWHNTFIASKPTVAMSP